MANEDTADKPDKTMEMAEKAEKAADKAEKGDVGGAIKEYYGNDGALGDKPDPSPTPKP